MMAERTLNGHQGYMYNESLISCHEAEMCIPQYANLYNMDHKNRGTAIILCHENFHSKLNVGSRTGTKVDVCSLERVLKKLGFDVQVWWNLEFEEIEEVIKRVRVEDHSDDDCLLLACLTHGEKGFLYAKSSKYRPEKLWYPFTADLCPSLAGKPKLFIIDAILGNELDDGVKLTLQVDSNQSSYRIPVHADFLIAYSTVPGYHSWGDAVMGSWFIQTLCQELSEHSFTHDILELLTNVNRKIAVDCESYEPGNANRSFKKQIPCIHCMLTRDLKFSEKNKVEQSTS